MNLQTHIRSNLWLAIKSTYEASNYTGAILDAMHYISNVLRERTGAEGDGQTLVGQALGGDSPRLRINKLQSETERNEQRGMESLLRGMYQAVRNPRSHEQMEDTQEAADAIIYFINYLLGIIEKSEEPFVTAKFMTSVFDPDFYRSQQYAELLVQQIPTTKRFDILVALYREKLLGDIHNVALVIHTLISKLPDDQVAQYLLIVSDELSTVTVEKEFRYCLKMVPAHLWEKLSDAPRLRAENRIIREIQKGSMYGTTCSSGGLATWARDQLCNFSLKDKVAIAFVEKLQSQDQLSQWYVVGCFFFATAFIDFES
jgi:uncharacterized protein (TIGR02391 family)